MRFIMSRIHYPDHFFPIRSLVVGIAFLISSGLFFDSQLHAEEGDLVAGVFAKNINPVTLPVWVNGGIAGKQVDRINDPLHARCLVLGDGRTQVAICIVDNCILPLELVDKAKATTFTKTGITSDHILIAATHTHSAVAVDGVHGTPVQQDYAELLPSWIAEGIAQAQNRMMPAQWGTNSVICERYIYCRDWMMETGKANSSPFSGRNGDSVSMNPGHGNPNKVAPVGPVDTLVPILSIQDMEGRPISVLASFCTHYAGSPNLSADYFGVVCDRLASLLRPDTPEAFVGLMANATSGNANCVDFSKPSSPFTHVDVGNYVSGKILAALPSIVYSKKITLDAELESIDLSVRMPTEKEVATAKHYIATHFPDRLPKTLDENYARETVLLSEMAPTRKLNLQAIRLNDFVIVANPCESYNETGLKLRQASPFRSTMNIGLANGHAGYIPPPEMYQLGGYTTWRCRTSCLEEQAEPKMVEGLVRVMRTLETRRKAATPVAIQSKPNSPVTPKESLKWLEMEAGYRVDLVAAEPQIVDPVSMRIDRLGRMWVVEMGDYPNKDNEPKGRIVVLQDSDEDNYYETSTVFADKLLFATGVQPWQDGAIVTVEGQLLMLRDTDGDLRADKTEVWLDGFATGNPQLRANHPILGADGWLYIASGLRGGKISATLPFKEASGEPLDLTGCDLRVHILTGQIESIAGPTQFGLSFDRFGRRYGCSNRNPCFEIISERAEISLSPLSGLASSLHDVSPSNSLSSVRPLFDSWTTSNLHAGQFTAACGLLVSHSSHFNSSLYATVLTCEPTGSLVQRRSILRQDGLLLVAPESSQSEWLASRDPWFRPVDAYEGPNGDIYIVDMYRAVIEHPEWVPAELKNRPDQRLGDSYGRIYRVTRKERTEVDYPKGWNSSTHLTESLTSPDTWRRNVAAQSVLEVAAMGDKEAYTATLRGICRDSNLPVGSIASACSLLSALNALDEETAESLFLHPSADLRSMVWKALSQSSSSASPKWSALAMKTLGAEEASVVEKQSAAWFIAAQSNDVNPGGETARWGQLLSVSTKALLAHNEHPHLWMAVTAACRNNLLQLLTHYRMEAGASRNSFNGVAREYLVRLATRAVQIVSPGFSLHEYANSIAVNAGGKPSDSVQACNFAILEGIARSGKLAVEHNSPLEKLAIQFASKSQDPVNQRSSVVILASSRSEVARAQALRCLDSSDFNIVKVAISTCSVHDTPEFTKWLLERFPSALPGIRQEIFSAIRNNPKRLSSMVSLLESGKLSTKVFDASQIQALSAIRGNDIAARLAKVLSSSANTNRQRVVEEYLTQFATMPVGKSEHRGKSIFAKHCATCHRLDNVGTLVGPDISDSREQSYEKLLISILDPNRSIDSNFFRYMVRTDEGMVFEGLLKDANVQTISLQGQNGALTIVRRSEIEELKSSGTSLMPEGIESQISPGEMAELLWYIKNWRYGAENIPANTMMK